MSIAMLVIGILVLVAAIGALIGSIVRTPENLRGFYGKMFGVITAIALIGGITLIVLSFLK